MALWRKGNHNKKLLDRLPLFDVPSVAAQRIGGVKDGAVYRIGLDLVAKVPHPVIWQNYPDYASQTVSDLEKEAEIGRKLYDLDVSVPRPYGFFKLDLNTEDIGAIRLPGFIMEFIDGVEGTALREDEEKFNRVMRLYIREINKAESLGFWPKDVKPFNFLYISGEDKVVLIDFNRWSHVGR